MYTLGIAMLLIVRTDSCGGAYALDAKFLLRRQAAEDSMFLVLGEVMSVSTSTALYR